MFLLFAIFVEIWSKSKDGVAEWGFTIFQDYVIIMFKINKNIEEQKSVFIIFKTR